MSGSGVLDVMGQVLVVLGGLVFLAAGVGLVRLRDVYARSSATATAAGTGISLVLVGVFLLHPSWPGAGKLVAAVLLQLATSAVGSMAVARAAYLVGTPMHTASDTARPDDLAHPHTADDAGRSDHG
ncbi:MAG: monovalent cation/H(+) antiporter subunit G [Tetrasphaera sp.]